jgi:hypothetical protein
LKWILVFFIATVPGTDEVDLYAFPNVPFDSQEACRSLVLNHYYALQEKVNREQNTVGVEYPPLCVSETKFYKAFGTPS